MEGLLVLSTEPHFRICASQVVAAGDDVEVIGAMPPSTHGGSVPKAPPKRKSRAKTQVRTTELTPPVRL